MTSPHAAAPDAGSCAKHRRAGGIYLGRFRNDFILHAAGTIHNCCARDYVLPIRMQFK
jgi:hypothetical protein